MTILQNDAVVQLLNKLHKDLTEVTVVIKEIDGGLMVLIPRDYDERYTKLTRVVASNILLNFRDECLAIGLKCVLGVYA